MAADQGLSEAQCAYVSCLSTGSGASVDWRSAAQYYKLAADQGLAEAQWAYGYCLEKGSGVPVDLKSAAQYYKLAADQGLAEAQFNYGSCLEKGSGVSVDLKMAAQYYKLAADQGLAQAQFVYSTCLSTGSGVSVDRKLAAQYLSCSAKQGFAEAQLVYGILCYHGLDRHLDNLEAASWFRRAADQGNLTASWCYGVCLYMGKGVEFNKEEARSRLQFAAENGDTDGKFCYGLMMFEENGCNLQPDSLGWKYVMESAAAGSAEASVIVALQNFANTNNFEHDAFKYALEKRDFCTLYNYAVSMFVANSSSEVELHTIADCFQHVAKQDGDGSEYSYKSFLAKGIGVDSDDRWRIVLIECGWGLPESEYLYGKHLYSLGKIDGALKYLKRASERRHAEAMFAYGAILVTHFGCRVTAPEVQGYFEQAAKDGILEAQYNYGRSLLSESTELRDKRHGVEVLSWAAKEILLRRQCKEVQVRSREQTCTFFYNPLPRLLTKRATDSYIGEHFFENIAKIARTPMYEILHPVTPTILPQQGIASPVAVTKEKIGKL